MSGAFLNGTTRQHRTERTARSKTVTILSWDYVSDKESRYAQTNYS